MYHTIFQLTNCTLFLECRFCTSHHIQVAAKKSKLHVIIRRKNKFHNLNSELEKNSQSGNRTPGVRVTGGNVTNYTNQDQYDTYFDTKLRTFDSVQIQTKKAATNGIRTHDLSLTKRVLYQLSYSGDRCYSGHLFRTESGF